MADARACGVDVVFAGHEHIMQHHTSISPDGHKMLHICCGATTESSFYNGEMKEPCVDWFEKGPHGFVSVDIRTTDIQSTVAIEFIEQGSLRVIKRVEMHKPLE